MSRSVWKGPFVDGYLLKKAEAAGESKKREVIKTWSRRSTILPNFVGLTFQVHNGNKFIPVTVSEKMLATSSANSLRPVHTTATARTRKRSGGSHG